MAPAVPSTETTNSHSTAAPPKLPRLPSTHRVSKRPLLHPPISSPYTSTSNPKIIYIRHSTPFIATVKRVRKYLEQIEKRRGGVIHLSKFNSGKKGDESLRRELDGVVKGRGKGGREEEEVLIKGTGRAITKVLQLAVYFQGERDLAVRVRTGSVGAVDDIVAKGGKEEGESEGGDGEGGADTEMKDGVEGEDEEIDLPESRVRRTSCLEVGVSLR